MKKVEVVDVTLKTLAKAPCEVSFREKLLVAKNLEKIGVNAVELPTLQEKQEDKIIYRTIAESIDTVIAIPVGETIESTKTAYECIQKAKTRRLQVIFPVSTVQMEYTYHVKAQKMLEKIASAVAQAKTFDAEVEFVAKDATRAEAGFLEQCAKTAEENGADIVTVCDTNGECFPDEFFDLVKKVKECCNCKVYVEISNKLKLAPAIFIACAKAGADGVKTAVDEEYLSVDTISNILRAKADGLSIQTTLDATLVQKVLKNVCELSKEGVLIGEQATGNKIMLNQNATLKDITEEVKALGYDLSATDIGKVYEEFMRVVTKKKEIGERELEAIVAVTAMQVPSTYHLQTYVVNSGNIMSATANVTLEKDGQALSGVSVGDGPIDAAFHAIEQIIGHHYELDDFNIQAVTKGREAVGSAIIRLRAEGKLYSGNGVSTDIVGACIRAYINALNKIVYEENKGEI